MARKAVKEFPLSKLDHVCIVVKDIEKAMKYYESLGVGPFPKPIKPGFIADEKAKKGCTYKETWGKMGPIQLQLLEPSPRGHETFQNIFKQFLDEHGEGMQHICYRSDNFKKDVAALEKKGFVLIESQDFTSGGGEAFFKFNDSGDASGPCLQLLQY